MAAESRPTTRGPVGRACGSSCRSPLAFGPDRRAGGARERGGGGGGGGGDRPAARRWRSDRTDARAAHGSEEGTCMSAARILVVDDESEIRGLLKEILADEGYEVDVAADASEARAIRTQHDPDLVLLDIWMPDTDGITLLREWAQPNGASCPVVM